MGVKSGNYLWPYGRMRMPPDEDRKMLQAHSGLTGVFDKAGVGIASIKGATDRGGATASAVLTTARKETRSDEGPRIRSPMRRVPAQKRFEDLVNQPSGQGKLVQRPALDPSMHYQRFRISHA